MRDPLDGITTFASRATWFATRDNGFPVVSESSDVFARAQLVGMIVCTAFVTLLVFMRFLVKYMSGTKMLLDDWTCLVAWISIMTYAATAMMMMHYGLGYHVWELSESNRVEIKRWLYASAVIYIPATYVTKVTLLLLVARVFAVLEKVVRGIYIFIIALFIAYLPVQLAKTFCCRPIPSFWDPSVAGTCLDTTKLFVCDITIAILTDVTILILPIPLTWSLSFSWRKKLKIGVLLGAGGAAVADTTYRMYLVVQYLHSTDTTYDFTWLAILTLLEMTLGLSCACLPTINVLVDRIRQRTTSSTGNRQQRPPNVARTGSSQLPAHRRREPNELSKVWSTLTGKTVGNTTIRAGQTSSVDVATCPAQHQQHRPICSFLSTRIMGKTHHSNNHDEVPIHNHGMELSAPQGNDETWSNHSEHIERPQTDATIPSSRRTTTPSQAEPQFPDFNLEKQMSSGKPLVMTNNYNNNNNNEQLPTEPEPLRLVDTAQGIREGWLAPAVEVSGGAGVNATATSCVGTPAGSAMAFNAQYCRSLRDTTGHNGAGPRRDWIWDGTWRN